MSEEQLNALEVWIESIIETYYPIADVAESLRRQRLKDDVRALFGIISGEE